METWLFKSFNNYDRQLLSNLNDNSRKNFHKALTIFNDFKL